MPALKLSDFDGMVPRKSPTLLGDNFAQVANNVKLYSGELRFWRAPSFIHAPPDAVYQTLYRMFSPTGDDAFLTWTTDVNVAVSPTADASGEGRIYYTGDGAPKKTNWAMAQGGAEPYPSSSYPMGVTPPAAAPTTALTTTGTGTPETRSYVFTFVQTFGAQQVESAPSPPSIGLSVPVTGSTVTVTMPTTGPAGQNVTTKRIYRTVVGATSVNYQFVAEIPLATATYADSKTAAQVGPDILKTTTWVGPPANLVGLVGMPGGVLAGFVGNTVYFSEPYYPDAWPTGYAITIPVIKIIGLGVMGSSLVVMTSTNPYFIHGGTPGEMYVEKIPLPEPCVGKATIASDEDGVVYASPNGLVSISPNARGLVTTNLFTTDEWRPLFPATMKGTILQGRYFGVFPNREPKTAIVLSREDKPALSYVQLPAIALHTDAVNGLMFFINDTDHDIYQLDADTVTPMDYQWRSKRFWFGKGLTFSLLRLDADYSQVIDPNAANAARDAALAWNAAHYGLDLLGAINSTAIHEMGDVRVDATTASFDINGSIMQNLPQLVSARSLQVVLYGEDLDNDGNPDLMANLSPFNRDPIRVPPFKSRMLEIAILGNINVRSLTLATTMEELLAAG
jgi:hypothetical protein